MISLTFGDLERSDQGHLLKNRFSVRDSAIVMVLFGDLGKSDQGHLLKNGVLSKIAL